MSRGGLLSSRVSGPKSSTEPQGHTWTPLRESYFAPPQVSSRERAYLVRKSCEAAQELVERTRSVGGPIVWNHVEKHNGVQLYAGSPRSSATGRVLPVASMCGVTSVPGTITEVASLFELGSTREMKAFACAHREWFYDGIVLHTLSPRTKARPLHQVTAKWMVMQMPRGLPHRDFCYLECQDKFIDAKGRKGWVLGQHSIKLPGCDDLKREFGLVRGSLYNTGLVVVESEERSGYLDVICLVQLNLKEQTPVPMSLLRARVLYVAQVRNMLRSKRLNEQRYLSDLELVPRKYRSRCAVCQDSFSLLLLRKMNCRKCGEIVCAACSKEFPIENRNFAETDGEDRVRKLRICVHCFQLITNAPKPTSALVNPPHSSTMSMSFLGYRDDNQRASFMTLGVGGQSRSREEDAPKIFLQSLYREKSSRRQMSNTSPISDFGGGLRPSSSRLRMQRGPDSRLHQSSRLYEQQDYGRSYNHRESRHMQPSNFRPSQSLSLDDPIGRGEGRYSLDMPGPPSIALPPSIFGRSETGALQRSHNELPRSNSSDMLWGSSKCSVSNIGRFNGLSSRERLQQLQREGDYMGQLSGTNGRMPDVYMSAYQQGSHDKRGFDETLPMYQAPPSDFGAYGAPVDDHPVNPPDFGPFNPTLDEADGPPPLDMSALTMSPRASSLAYDSVSTAPMFPAAHQDGGNEHRLLRLREHEVQQHCKSTSLDSSAISINIDTCEDIPKYAVVPPISEQQKQNGEQMYDEGVKHVSDLAPSNMASVPKVAALHENGMQAAWTRDIDEDSETSMGASDEDEERCSSEKLTPLSMAPLLYRAIDGNVDEATGKMTNTAGGGVATGKGPVYERTATSAMDKSGEPLAPVESSRLREDKFVLDNMNMEKCQDLLDKRNSFADSMVLGAQTEKKDTSLPKLESPSRLNHASSTGRTVEVAVEDPVVAGAQRNSKIAHCTVQSIAQQDRTATYASSEIPTSLVLSGDSETLQTSSGDILESSYRPRLSPSNERNRSCSSGSNDMQVLRYQSNGYSVLNTSSDINVHSALTSDGNASKEANSLLLARQLYEHSNSGTTDGRSN